MRKAPLWRVRLAFGGAPFDTEDGHGGGFVSLTVRAPDAATARRAALVFGPGSKDPSLGLS